MTRCCAQPAPLLCPYRRGAVHMLRYECEECGQVMTTEQVHDALGLACGPSCHCHERTA